LTPKGESQGRTTTPEQFAETLPPEVAQGHSFSVQAIFELQRAFGRVEKAIEGLEAKVEAQGKTLRTIERLVWIATGVFLAGGAILGFLLNEGLEVLKTLKIGH
jgi:hypothetical protein